MKIFKIAFLVYITIFFLSSCTKNKSQEPSFLNNNPSKDVENDIINGSFDNNITKENDVYSNRDKNGLFYNIFEDIEKDIVIPNKPYRIDRNQTVTIINKPYNIGSGKYAESSEYYILDYPINIRSQPNINGNVTGRLNLHDKIILIENMGNEQEIENVLQNWYKIKFEEIEGYIWGGYISVDAFIHDIDGNGIDDYFYFRYSRIQEMLYNGSYDPYDPLETWYDSPFQGEERIIKPSDIIIYINNERIQISEIEKYYNSNSYDNIKKFWKYCSYSYSDGIMYINLHGNEIETVVFTIDEFGIIKYNTIYYH